MQTKFWAAALLGFVLVAATACGGGGGGLTAMEEEELRMQLADEEKARKEAEAEAERQRLAAEEAERKRKEEEEARLEAEEELEEVAENLDEVTEDLDEAEDLAETVEGEREQLEQQLTEAQQAELNARASAYITAINSGGTPRSGVNVEYMRGSSLTINPGGNFETGSGAPAISGFTARTYTREVGVTGEQTLYLYTNIQAPGTRAFWKLHGVDEIAGAQANNFDPTPTGTARVVRAGTGSIAYTDGDTYDIAVSGTYDGVSGTYTCTACTIVDGDDDGEDVTAADFNPGTLVMLSNGERSFAAGNSWDFKPGSINSGVQQDQDTEFLYFGTWVQEPNVASEPHMYQYIVGGSQETLTYDNLTGTARFTGDAVGRYVTRDQVGDNAAIGTFIADVNLTANFDANTLEGRINSFRDGSRELTNWNVYLGGTATGPVTSFSGSVEDGVVAASIGGVGATGTWDAALHGTDNVVIADREEYPASQYPAADLAGIVGNFHATSTNAALAGAFGAACTTGTMCAR